MKKFAITALIAVCLLCVQTPLNTNNREVGQTYKTEDILFVSSTTHAVPKSIHAKETRADIEARITFLMNKAEPKIKDKDRKPIMDAIIKYSKKYDFSPVFVAAVILQESNFQKTLVEKSTKCVGLMQVYQKHHTVKMKKLGLSREDLYRIDANLNVGLWILREHIDRRNGNLTKGLMDFNGVSKNIKRGKKYVNDIYALVFEAYGQKFA